MPAGLGWGGHSPSWSCSSGSSPSVKMNVYREIACEVSRGTSQGLWAWQDLGPVSKGEAGEARVGLDGMGSRRREGGVPVTVF